MSPMVIKIVAVVILLVAIVVTALLTKTISIKRYQESENQKLNNAEDKARQIIDEAVKTAVKMANIVSNGQLDLREIALRDIIIIKCVRMIIM